MEVDIVEFSKRFQEEYKRLYDAEDRVDGFEEAVRAFDECMENENFRVFANEFATHRFDFVTSDREAAAFMFALSFFVDEDSLQDELERYEDRYEEMGYDPYLGCTTWEV